MALLQITHTENSFGVVLGNGNLEEMVKPPKGLM